MVMLIQIFGISIVLFLCNLKKLQKRKFRKIIKRTKNTLQKRDKRLFKNINVIINLINNKEGRVMINVKNKQENKSNPINAFLI